MSSFFDDVKAVCRGAFHKGRKGVDDLAVAIDERTEMAKLNSRIRALTRERGELVTQVGKKVYSLHTRQKVRNRDILQDCERIDGINDEVGRLREAIEALRRGPQDDLSVPPVEDETPLEDEEQAPDVEETGPSQEAVAAETQAETPA